MAEMSQSDRYYCLSEYRSSIGNECPCSSYLRTLEGIKDELRILSDRSSAGGYKENEADGRALSELAEDLRDAVIEYQVGPDPWSPIQSFAEALRSLLNRSQCTSKTVD